jgi:glycosyltransferase involved in cell wall biosynthesis
MHKKKLLVINTHPVNYHVPIYRSLSSQPELDVLVCFLWNPFVERNLSKRWPMQFDKKLLTGYRSIFIKNYMIKRFQNPNSILGCLNFGIINIVKRRFDAILIFGYNRLINVVTLWVARFFNIPVMFKGEVDLSARRSKTKRFIKRVYLNHFFKRIDYFLYSYQKNYDYYRNYGVPEHKLFFLPCAVDNDHLKSFYEKITKVQAKEKLCLSQTKKYILFVGRLEKRKDPITLLKAFALICSQINVDLIFVGSGELEQELIQKVKSSKLSNRVIFAGFKKSAHVYYYYRAVDILVLPSIYDPSPKVLNECMNFGIPAIVSDTVGTANDLISHGVNGFVFPVGNTEKLALFMQRLLIDYVEYKHISQQCFDIIDKWQYIKGIESICHIMKGL